MKRIRKFIGQINKPFWAAVILIVPSLVTLHGLWPGMAGPNGGALASRYAAYGSISCGDLAIKDLIKESKCPLSGGTKGQIVPANIPFTAMSATIARITNLNTTQSYTIVAILIITVSLLGAYVLIRYLEISRIVALTGATLYLLLPLVIYTQPFGGTYWGFMLLPASLGFVWSVLVWLDKSKLKKDWPKYVLAAQLWMLVSTIMLFTDGYSFVMYSMAAAIMIFVWSWGRWSDARIWLAGFMFLVASIFAYGIFALMIPSTDSWSESLDVFRAMSLDVATLFIPSNNIWWAQVLHINPHMKFWGDGSNSANNYIGFVSLGLFLYGLYKLRNKLTRLTSALLIIGACSLIFSIGPTLKFAATNNIENKSGVTGRSNYLMPVSDGVVNMPTAKLFSKLPGLKSMRATYRWHVLTLLVIIIFALLGVQILLNNKKYHKLGWILLGLMVIELMPNPARLIATNISTGSQMQAFNKDVMGPLSQYVSPGSRVLLYPSDGNDYLAPYIAPQLNINLYNVGGDKARDIADKYYPTAVSQLLSRNTETSLDDPATTTTLIYNILSQDLASDVILPKFRLRWDSYSWPPRQHDAADAARAIADTARQTGKFTVIQSEYFYIIRLR